MTILTKSVRLVWRNPYITDGLIAMWDGEWNAGGGIHDANAVTWKDCVGGLSSVDNLLTYGSWTPDSFDSTYIYGYSIFPKVINATIGSWEVVCESYHSHNDVCKLSMYSSVNDCVILKSDYHNIRGYKTRIGWNFGSQTGSILNQNEVGIDTPFCFAMSGLIDASDRRNDMFYYNGSYTGRFSYGEAVSVNGYFQMWVSTLTKVRLKCVRYYTRLLNADEIASNYAIDRVRFGLP